MAEEHKNEAAGDERAREDALFKFSLIAPVVAGTFTQATKMDYYRETSSREHRLSGREDGKAVPAYIEEMVLALHGRGP